MIRLIASDIDGTLLKTGTTMPDPAYYRVIGQLVEDTRALGPEAECMYCTKDTAYFSPLDQSIQKLMTDKFYFHCKTVDKLTDLPFPCIKFSVKIKDELEEGLRQWFIPKWQKSHEVTRGGNYVSVMQAGVTKGSSIKKI